MLCTLYSVNRNLHHVVTLCWRFSHATTNRTNQTLGNTDMQHAKVIKGGKSYYYWEHMPDSLMQQLHCAATNVLYNLKRDFKSIFFKYNPENLMFLKRGTGMPAVHSHCKLIKKPLTSQIRLMSVSAAKSF